MGFPEPRDGEPKRTTAAPILVAIAAVAAGALLLAGLLIVYRWTFVRSAPPKVATVVDYGTTEVRQRSWSTEDLKVEVDQQGQTYYHGQPLPLEQIKPQIQDAMSNVGIGVESLIHVVEGCPFEHVEAVVAIYQELGIANPRMATVPPHRTVTVTLDEEGKALIDGETVEDPQSELQRIAARHGSRAKVVLEAHPKCPAQFVVRLAQRCRDSGLGDVQVKTIKEEVAERTE